MNAIITGGAGDIGRACAASSPPAEARPVVDTEFEAAERVAREINQGADGKGIAISADVSIAADVRRDVARAADWGPVDGIAHAAGIAGPAAPLPDFDETQFDRVMAVNARGTFLGMKYALPYVRDGGAIVNIASVTGIAGYPRSPRTWHPNTPVIGLTRAAALKAHRGASASTRSAPDRLKAALISAAAGTLRTLPTKIHSSEDFPFIAMDVPTRSPKPSPSCSPRQPDTSPTQRSQSTGV